MGLTFKHLHQDELAAYCFRKYIDISSLGIEGSYSIRVAKKYLRESHQSTRAAVEQEFQEAAEWIRQSFQEEPLSITEPPELDRQRLQHLQKA
jgi:hypothetical protein